MAIFVDTKSNSLQRLQAELLTTSLQQSALRVVTVCIEQKLTYSYV